MTTLTYWFMLRSWRKKEGFTTTKSSLEAENARLSKLASKEEKKRVRAEDREELKREHSEMNSWMCMIALESIRAYKASEECVQAKRDYASDFYLFEKDRVRAKVALKYPMLRLPRCPFQ